jgi:hypothetical protein
MLRAGAHDGGSFEFGVLAGGSRPGVDRLFRRFDIVRQVNVRGRLALLKVADAARARGSVRVSFKNVALARKKSRTVRDSADVVVAMRFSARMTSGQILFRRRSTLAFELLAQLVGALLQIFLQLLLLRLEHLGVRGRTFISFLETIS